MSSQFSNLRWVFPFFFHKNFPFESNAVTKPFGPMIDYQRGDERPIERIKFEFSLKFY